MSTARHSAALAPRLLNLGRPSLQSQSRSRMAATIYEVIDPLLPSKDKSHHVNSPPTSFRNPWPSFPPNHANLTTLLKTRFLNAKPPFVPVPSDRAGLVGVHQPNFTVPEDSTGFKVTWIGHASFAIQCFTTGDDVRSVNVLLDPVFAERTSPVAFIGPKRYTPTPCSVDELLQEIPIDVVCISHNHYDHADTNTLKAIYNHGTLRGRQVLFCVGLGNSRWLTGLGIPSVQVWEGDWWDRIAIRFSPMDEKPSSHPVEVGNAGANTSTMSELKQFTSLKITCTPSQHASKRGLFDGNTDLWCSWAFELTPSNKKPSQTADHQSQPNTENLSKSLFFAGDTGYRTVPEPQPGTNISLEDLPVCPAFAEIGSQLGPFDLALLPIGLNRPRHLMSSVHANAQDSMDIHRDINSKRSDGMHWGTVRGGISAYYEDVLDPPREWEDEARKANKIWRDRKCKRENATDISDGKWEIGLLDVGESLIV